MGSRAAVSEDVYCQTANSLVHRTEVCLSSCLGGAIGFPKGAFTGNPDPDIDNYRGQARMEINISLIVIPIVQNSKKA